MHKTISISAIRNDTDFYYLNGEFKLTTVGQILQIAGANNTFQQCTFVLAGTTFVYEIGPDRKESITARGPLNEDIHIAVGLKERRGNVKT